MENDDKKPPPTGAQSSTPSSLNPYPRLPLTPTQLNHLLNLQQQRLKTFHACQLQEIEEEVQDFKNNPLPFATIKRIMKFDKDVNMISAEASILFSKACELFIMELTIRSWMHAEAHKCGTLQKDDVFASVRGDERYDYLLDDVVPKDETKNQGGVGQGVMGSMVSGVPYHYLPGCMMGRAIDQSVYPQPTPLQAWRGNMAYGSGNGGGGGGVGQGVSGVQHYYPPGAIMGRPAIDHGVYPQPAKLQAIEQRVYPQPAKLQAIEQRVYPQPAPLQAINPSVYNQPSPLQAIDQSVYPQPASLQAWQYVLPNDMASGNGSGSGGGGGGDQGNLDEQG